MNKCWFSCEVASVILLHGVLFVTRKCWFPMKELWELWDEVFPVLLLLEMKALMKLISLSLQGGNSTAVFIFQCIYMYTPQTCIVC